MNYGNVLSSAWKTVWKHKVIFWFGLLMAIPQALMGIVMGGVFYFLPEEKLYSFLEGSSAASDTFLLFYILFIVGMILITVLSYVMMAISFAGTLKGTFDLKDQETTISFGELWGASLPFAWRIFGLFFIIFAGLFAVLIVIMLFVGLITVVTAGIGMLCFMPLMLLILPLELVVLIFASIAMAAIVTEDIGIFDAMRKAKDILKQKFWYLVLMGIIVAFIVWIVSMIAMLPMQIAQFSFMMPMMQDPHSYVKDPTVFFRPYTILMVIMMPLMGIVQGLSFSYMNAVWIFAYLDITVKPESDGEVIEHA